MKNRLALLCSFFGLASCATAPLPFTGQSESGLAFWTIAPLPETRAVSAFHWREDEFSFAYSTASGLETTHFAVSGCPLLRARLVQFREAVLESVEMVFDRRPIRPSNTITLDGPLYRAMYAPDRHSTTVILEGPTTERLTWVSAALDVEERARTCVMQENNHDNFGRR